MNGRIAWIIFDADNTLWRIEHLYDASRQELCRFLASKGTDATLAEQYQQARDRELYDTYGYSACRFARSFEDTLYRFHPQVPSSEVRHVRRLALEVFEQRAEPEEGLEDLLDSLSSAGYYIGIITAGERWVQERRLNDFHLRDRFHAVEIVEAKTAETFMQFCERHKVDERHSWVVGDSIRSDVLPAIAAGLRAVLLRARNWTPVEGGRENVPESVPMIEALKDLAAVPGVLPV